MAGKIPDTVWLYRIVHIDNVEYLLKHGMCAKAHPQADPDYINIGDSNLIAQREEYEVGIDPPGGNLGDFVPFYFGPLSPMLLNIYTGYRGITKRPQADIVYICCKLEHVIEHCAEWCFTDGHAKNNFTEFYNDLSELKNVDWGLVRERYWHPTQDDMGKMRRKQAEFLIKKHVSVKCVNKIIVYTEQSSTLVQSIIDKLGLDISVKIDPGENYYYK